MDNFDNKVSNIKFYKHESIQIHPKYDTYINSNDQDKNYGNSDLLFADDHGSKFLIAFDLTSIPTSAKITQASINLTKIG